MAYCGSYELEIDASLSLQFREFFLVPLQGNKECKDVHIKKNGRKNEVQ